MNSPRKSHGFRCNRYSILNAPMLCLWAFIPPSRADLLESISTGSTAFFTNSVATRTQPPGLGVLPSQTIPYNITSSAISTSTEASLPELFPAATGPADGHVHNGTVFNYYFLFLAALCVLLVALLWWVHRQRKRRKQQLHLNGQHALARDLEGWAGARRFMHGRHGQYLTPAHTRREEGLDEHGDAPPPYQPKSDVTVETVQDPGREIAIPLQALLQNEHDRARPPGYTVAVGIQP
jgi:cbb3-type cytochrome oxidase subunit 3